MPAGGVLTVSVRNLTSIDPLRPDATAMDGSFVRITVADSGIGMDERTMTRIFDPFFTTKSAGKGTGLGLATVFGIVSQSDGRIEVESSPGQGATFNIDLPRADPGDQPASPRPSPRPLVRGSGVVLLAEDEPAVRDFARRALEAAGYTVLTAANGVEALRASGRWHEQIDVLLTDVVMPGMHGPELAYRVRDERPGIGILFTSGYAEDAVARGGEFETPGAFLPKPFTADALIRAVGRAAAAAHAAPDSEVRPPTTD
jgi:two-component system cell cycle sensor histidine kinase/response regulator CckA